jgi:hypothetical protein
MIPTMLYLFTRRLHSNFGTELQQLDFATIARPLECSLIMRAFKILGWWRGTARFEAHGERVGLVPNLVWRVKLVAELRPGVLTETEVARIERDEQAGLADLRLRLAETNG